MLFYSLLSALSFIPFLVFVAAMPSTTRPTRYGGHLASADSQTVPSLSYVSPQQEFRDFNSNGRFLARVRDRKPIVRGKDKYEKLIALCEAGFLEGCRESIKKAKPSALEQISGTQPARIPSPIVTLPSFVYTIEEDGNAIGEFGFPFFRLFLILICVVCIVTIVYNCMNSSVVLDYGKRSPDI